MGVFIPNNKTDRRVRPRSRNRLWGQIYFALVVFATTPTLLALMTNQSSTFVLIVGIVGLPVILACAYLGANVLMTPVYLLHARLIVSNQKEGVGDIDSFEADILTLSQESPATASHALALKTWAAQGSSDPHRKWELPFELHSIEMLAARVNVSDLAMESVKKDIFRHISHQLKSPMAQLRAQSEAARKSAASGAHEKLHESLTAIDEISMNVAGLVEQMLSLAWVEQLERRGIGKDLANLSEALIRAARACALSASAKGITIKSTVFAGLWVEGEGVLLEEMITSLLNNAIRYSPSASLIQLETTTSDDESIIYISVSDQGPGIPESEYDKVFDPFYGSLEPDVDGTITYGARRHRTMNAKGQKSHGLGLALVRSIAKLYKATITLSKGSNETGLRVQITIEARPAPD